MNIQQATLLAEKISTKEISLLLKVAGKDSNITKCSEKCKDGGIRRDMYELYVRTVESHISRNIELCLRWKIRIIWEFGNEEK